MSTPIRQLSEPYSLIIDGYLLPVDERGWPLLVRLPDLDDRFLLIFSSKRTLDRACADFHLSYATIKQVTDGEEFLDSIAMNKPALANLRIAADAYKHENGNTRFTEVSLWEDD